jgi:predicted DNA-binding transcriptional regulator YafY
MKDNRFRWKILDSLLGSGHPVSSEDIFREWERKGVSRRFGSDLNSLQDQYEVTLRQDLFKFRKAYKESGFDGELLEESFSANDKRRKSYRYKEEGFSILPLLREKYTKAHWKEIDNSLSQLFQIIPESLADQIDFLVNSRLDTIKNSSTYVEWPDNPQLLGYEMLPTLYKVVKRHQPIQISFAMFDQPTEQFILHPYLLKEYNGRWYCLGYREDQKRLWPVSVDRIKQGSIHPVDVPFRSFYSPSASSPSEYFKNVIGVTKEYNEVTAKDFYVSDGEYEVKLKVSSKREWMYLVTNPIHNSQRVISDYDEDKNEGLISIKVICNIEMYNTILSRGRHVQIVSPPFAREVISSMVKDMASLYE